MKEALEQLTAISMDKESGREQLATLLFDNAFILKQNTNTARLCVQINLICVHDELELQLVSTYKPQIFSYTLFFL